MTGDKAGTVHDLRVGGRPLAPLLRARAPHLSRRVLAQMLSELPTYAQLPQEEVAGDIADIVQRSVRLFADVLERRRPADDAALTRQRESAAQRAEEGVPLDAILTAYHLGVAMIAEELTADARPGDLADVLEMQRHLLRTQRQLTSAVSGAYLEARQLIDSQEQGGRHALMAALLAGEPVPDRSGHHGALRPADRYVTLALFLAPHPDERERDRTPGTPGAPGTPGTPGSAIAARRKVRRVRAVLDRYAGQPVMTDLDATGGTALVPVATPPPWEELHQLIADCAESAGAPITAAATTTDPADPAAIPAAVTQNTDIVQLALRTGRRPGLYRLADVLLEYQLSRPGAARTELALLLAPLDHKPVLLKTLETYIHRDLDRTTTASALHVHPNTVAYRVRRITELTGLSPHRPTDLQHLNAALLARRCGP
ncbi:PucR family transcriptional regulator [Streptomyces sp. NPDC059009]|uniref:PucR family transcriptional regulator n=1 Tax=Streptomyces sp. NPDC059009 TaxID=3346694 RepID=UPI00369D4FC5